MQGEILVIRRLGQCSAPLRLMSALGSRRFSARAANRRLKPWNDARKPTGKRAQALVNANQLHPADFYEKELENLLRSLGKKKLVGLQQAQNVMDRLVSEKKRLYDEERVSVAISEKLWQIVVFGWVQLADKVPAASLRIEELVATMLDLARQDQQSSAIDKPHSSPTTSFFNTVLHGFARASQYQAAAPRKAEDTLDLMRELHREKQFHTRPNSRSYVYVMQAYHRSKVKQSGERALEVFRRLQEEQADREEAYRRTYGQKYNYKDPESNLIQIPEADIVCYTACMQAILACPDTPAQLALDLLTELLHAGTPEPDAMMFSMAIQGLGKQVKGLQSSSSKLEVLGHAEEVLGIMLKVAEDRVADWDLVYGYNACLHAWANSDFLEAAEGAERVLQSLLESDRAKPDTVSFNSALHAWARSTKFHAHAASRAEQLFDLQQELLVKGAIDRRAMPDFQTYATVIQAHAKSSDPDRTHHARRILDSMLLNIKTNEIKWSGSPSAPFTAVLNACARGPKRAGGDADSSGFTSEVDTHDDYSLAIQIFSDLCDDSYGIDVTPDHHAYAAFLRCVLEHSPPGTSDRQSMAQMAFEDACRRGCVSQIVVDVVKNLNPSLLEEGRLPKFWSRNVEPGWLPRPRRKRAANT